MSEFICPFCKKSLINEEKCYICENCHSFDKAKEGYVHLLPVNKMHSKVPGDTKEMVSSRRRFLQSGYYDIFSDKLNEIVSSYSSDNIKIVDCGCGEGFYTGRLHNCLNNFRNVTISAFDISKCAVKYAAKSDKRTEYAVASIFDIPISDSSSDIIINIFAPFAESEFLRILKKNGIMIYAVPSENHLFGLKEIAYENPYKNEIKDTIYNGFELVSRIPVRDKIEIKNSSLIDDLFTMTPYYWKTDMDGCERIAQAKELKTEIGFDFLIYRKK